MAASETDNAKTAKETPTPYKQETQAMEICAVSFDSLNDDQRRRVHFWLGQRYNLHPRY